MKSYLLLALMLAFTAGCNSSSNEPQRRTADHAESPESKFDIAIETIATSTDMAEVHAANKILRNGGLGAISSLREHLDDIRVPPNNYLTRAVSGNPSMGAHCYWLIQDIIEPPVPKLFAGLYATLNSENIEPWLDERSGKTIRELKIDAATNSLELAARDLKNNDNSSANRAIEIYCERLETLKGQ